MVTEPRDTAEIDAPARLSVNINADCAAHMEAMSREGLTATEVVRQALALHKCIRDGGRVIPPGEGRA